MDCLIITFFKNLFSENKSVIYKDSDLKELIEKNENKNIDIDELNKKMIHFITHNTPPCVGFYHFNGSKYYVYNSESTEWYDFIIKNKLYDIIDINTIINIKLFKLESYDFSNWSNKGKFFIEDPNKRYYKKTLRLTGSNITTAIGENKYKTKEQFFLEFFGYEKPVYTEESKINMNLGNEYEKYAQRWYSEIKNVKLINNIGTGINKSDYRIGGRPDSVYEDWSRLVEYKCIKRLYQSINKFIEDCNSGIIYDEYYHDHIPQTHYDQMQCYMWIFGIDICDYVLYTIEEEQNFIQSIPYNKSYWEDNIYPKVSQVLTDNFIKYFNL